MNYYDEVVDNVSMLSTEELLKLQMYTSTLLAKKREQQMLIKKLWPNG